MTEYPSNSNKKKREDRKMEKVVEGKVITRRKPFSRKIAETFTPIDVAEVMELVIFDQAIPGIKRLILDTLTEGGERMFFGDTRKRRNMPGQASYTSYHKISTGGAVVPTRPQLSREARAKHDFEQVVLESRADAEEILEKLGFCIEEYGVASVSDLYEMLGMDEKWHTDNKWGWTDIADARVKGVREGWLLDLPKPRPLD